jgi:hypothetical protein
LHDDRGSLFRKHEHHPPFSRRAVGAKALAQGHQIGEPGASSIDIAVILATAPAIALVDADDVVDVIRDPAVFQRNNGRRRHACRRHAKGYTICLVKLIGEERVMLITGMHEKQAKEKA